MKIKLAAIWKILTNEYWMLFNAKGEVLGVTPKNISYLQLLIDLAKKFDEISKETKGAKK